MFNITFVGGILSRTCGLEELYVTHVKLVVEKRHVLNTHTHTHTHTHTYIIWVGSSVRDKWPCRGSLTFLNLMISDMASTVVLVSLPAMMSLNTAVPPTVWKHDNTSHNDYQQEFMSH